jgi:Cu/Ag efflux protein CusF
MFKRIAFALALCLGATSASAAQKEFSASRSETLTAKVKKVDQQTREVTLVGEDGTETTFKANEKVRNLAQVKEGDVLTATLGQTLTLWLLAEGQPAPELAVGADVFRAPAGQKPGGMMTADLSGVATVEAISPDKKSVSLKGPRGNVVKLKVKDPKNLDGVTIGQRVGFAYSETLAIDVKAGKAEKKAPAKTEKKAEKKTEKK